MHQQTESEAEPATLERLESEQSARDALEHARRTDAEEAEDADGAQAIEDSADRAGDEKAADGSTHQRPFAARRGVAQPTARTPASENCAMWRATASMLAGVGSNLRPSR